MSNDTSVHGPRAPWRATRSDLVVAAVVAVAQVGITVVAASHQPERDSIDALALVLLATGPVALVWRRRFPVAVLGIAFAATLAYWVIGYGRGPIFLALIVAFVNAVHEGRRGYAWASLAVGYVAFLWLPVVAGTDGAPGWAAALGLAAWLLVLATVTEIVRVGRERASATARSREEEALRRASEERLQIARELHDVVAHNISLINVQASVGLHLMHEDPEQAEVALAAIKAASKNALDEFRSVLEILRGDDRAPLVPTATLDDIDELVQRAVTAGLDVHVDVQGRRRPLPPQVEVAAYRLVQEALTNVVRHSGATTALVRLSYNPDALVVQVDDNGLGALEKTGTSGAGQGLTGMRERVVALGGRLDAAPKPAGGFRVRAWIPIGSHL
jgi:signal transduction histidine kinase